MKGILRDKAWARRFARTSGDLGITHVGPRYRFPIRLWAPTKVPQKARRLSVTVPQPLCRPAQKNTSTPVECAQAGFPLPSGVSCDREHEYTAGRQSQRNPFIGDEAPELIERYADIRGI